MKKINMDNGDNMVKEINMVKEMSGKERN